ncbi:hypothetical protein Tco_0915568 [Tanacetum coccineum]
MQQLHPPFGLVDISFWLASNAILSLPPPLTSRENNLNDSASVRLGPTWLWYEYSAISSLYWWYLKGKPKLGLWYPRVSSFDLEAYSDSDYAGANLDRKSTTRGCQFLGRRLISWQCKKQTIVATSTTEAEYVVLPNCMWASIVDSESNVRLWIQFYETQRSTIDNGKHQYALTKLSTARPKLSTDNTKIESMKLEAMVEERRIFKCWFHYHITNGHQFTISNRHQELASPEQTAPGQMATGKEISNPFMAGSLPKTT